jgi:hypothetical protein
MKSQESKYQSDLLETITQVEISPSVWFKIQNSIMALNAERFSTKMSWAVGLAAVLIVALNIMIWFSNNKQVPSENLADTFGLNTHYNLYE